MSLTAGRRFLGLENIPERVKCINNAVAEAEAIRSAYYSIASVQEKATMAEFCIMLDDDHELNSSESDVD